MFTPTFYEDERPFTIDRDFAVGDIIGSIGGDLISSEISVPSLPTTNPRYNIFAVSGATVLTFCCRRASADEDRNAEIILTVSRKNFKIYAVLRVVKPIFAGEMFLL